MKKKDKVSDFLAHELLYDFVKDQLSEDRRKAVQDVLDQSSELRLQLKHLEEKLALLSQLDGVCPSAEWVEELSLPHPSLAQQLVSFEKKLAPRFWRTLPLTVLIGALIFGVVLFQPWMWVKLNEVEVAQVHMMDDEVRMEAAIALSEKDIEGAMKAQENPPSESSAQGAPEEKGSLKIVDSRQNPDPLKEKSPVAKKPEKAKVGEIYRAFMTVDDLLNVTDRAVSKIKELGGRKAGQVQLGWERDEDERYFHFSLPEKNKSELMKFLSNFSQVRLSSQEHPLVMPAGKIRIILVVKQNPQVERPPAPEPTQEESPEVEVQEQAP